MYIVVLAYLLCYIVPAMILDILQIRYIRFRAAQKPVILNSKDYITAANYAIARHRISLVEHVLTFVLLLFWLCIGIPYISQTCDTDLTSSFGTDWLVLMCFSAIHMLFHIPITLAHKRLDTIYGFNKQGLRDICIDGVKMVCLSGILLGIVFALLLWIMETISLWWIVGFIVMFCLLLLMQVLYPTLIAPMFNKITPLQDEALSERIQELLRCVGFQSSGIFVIDASKRDGRLNAYFGGLGSAKRVMLFDTLLERISEDGLIAILGHELGHFKHGDLIRNLIVSAGIFFILFLIMGLFFHSLCLYLELPPTDSTILILAILLLPVLLFLFMPIQSYFSRKAEYRADAFGASCVSNKALSDALVRLVNENKAFPYSHPAYIFFYYSHPPLLERLKALGGLYDRD